MEADARFLIVGAHAMAVHGVPRATGDLDVWIDCERVNAGRVWRALLAFGVPFESLDISKEDLEKPDTVVQIGLPPRRIDILTAITGVEFEAAWKARVSHVVGNLKVPFIGRREFLINKRATGRLQDLADVDALEREGDGGPS
ncbi:MAG: hypothetical protein H0V09_02765 [Gemmatimonadetes bacterium]|nr:hypothetical protein [Gemmatimonadota bacterium]